jgi:hypothetical protein
MRDRDLILPPGSSSTDDGASRHEVWRLRLECIAVAATLLPQLDRYADVYELALDIERFVRTGKRPAPDRARYR